MKTKAIFNNLNVLMLSLIIGFTVSYTAETYFGTELSPGIGTIGFMVFALIPKTRGALGAISVEFWVNYIAEELFANNEFLLRSKKEDDYVLGGKTVHRPQAGNAPNVVKNPTVFPLTASKRVDSDSTYDLDNYYVGPTHIEKAELQEISYNKIDSVLGGHMRKLKERAAEEMIIKWADGAATTLRTTGDAVETHLTGTTGNRKKFVKEDLLAAQVAMDNADVPMEGRVLLAPASMLGQLKEDADLMKRDTATELDLKRGVIHKLYGFEIMQRSKTAAFDVSANIKAYGAAAAVTDNDAAIAWHVDFVGRAVGDVTFFENIDDALYAGDVYTGHIKFGGKRMYENGTGVLVIVQDAE